MGNGSCGSRGECGRLLSPFPHFSFQEHSSRNLRPDWLGPKISTRKEEDSTIQTSRLLRFLFCFIFHLNIFPGHSELLGREGKNAFSPGRLFLSYHQYPNMARCSLTSLQSPLGTSKTIKCSAPRTALHPPSELLKAICLFHSQVNKNILKIFPLRSCV